MGRGTPVESSLLSQSSPPSAPEGYREPYQPPPVSSWLDYLPGEFGLLVVAGAVFGVLAVGLRGSTDVVGVLIDAAGLSPPRAYLAVVVAVGVTLVLHELVHGMLARVYGCEVSFGRRGFGVYTRLRGGFVSRRAEVVMTLAPVVVLTLMGLPLLVMDSAVVATAALVGLVVNVAGMGGDVGDVLRVRRLPAGSLLYYGDETQLVYEPLSGR